MRHLTPAPVHPPFARYSHGVEVRAGARMLFCSGQLGIRPDGTVPEGAEAQTAQALANVAAVLAEAGMGPGDIVRLNAYVADRAHLTGYMAARDAFIAGIDPPPASTLMVVTGFARPEFLVEVEAIAAREDA